MPALIFHCPVTGLSVQGFVAEGIIGPDTVYVPIDCVMCSRSHLIDVRAPKSPNADDK
jgi:hypothetical protein